MPVTEAKKYRNDININAVRNFLLDFKNAENVTRTIANDGGYVARFIHDSVQTILAYDHRGSWNYTLRKFAENKMPAGTRAMVKPNYFDHIIIEVTEIKLFSSGEI